MPPAKPLENLTVVLDNGADSIKIGVVLENAKEKNGCTTWTSNSLTVPNFIGKSKTGKKRFISTQMGQCHDTSGVFISRAFDRGYMCVYDLQRTIWEYIFSTEALNLDLSQTDLLFTEPVNNFQYARNVVCEMLFEDFGFRSVCMMTAAQLAENDHMDTLVSSGRSLMTKAPAPPLPPDLDLESFYNGNFINEDMDADPSTSTSTDPLPNCTLVVESGFSFTHVIPFMNGRMVKPAIRRINVGGKLLTNQLKEILSYRQLNVLDETYLVNQVKEDTCFVSLDFNADMQQARHKWPVNKNYQEYVLPDFSAHRRGFVRSTEEFMKRPGADEQILKMNNERFSVPELLFNPSDIGLNQMGVGDLIHEVIQQFPGKARAGFYGNILLIGGNAKFPGFRDRVHQEVRKLCPDDCDVNVTLPDDPIAYACHGGNKLAYKGRLEKFMVSRLRYMEEGRVAEVLSLRD